MIKVIRARLIKPSPEAPIRTLHVEIDIDGYRFSFGGLPATWNRTELMDYLNNEHEDLLRKAQQHEAQLIDRTILQRPDLLDETPRDIVAELDDVKTRIASLEAKVIRA